MTDVIISVAAVISAITVIIVAVKKTVKPILELCQKVDNIEQRQMETYLSTLRLTICSEEIPLEERITAGDKYIKAGGNGAVKHKYEGLLRHLDEEK